ncbi:MAG: hypothetical protein Alpg2KO_14580 [Alphaproteobacteria bacterium]
MKRPDQSVKRGATGLSYGLVVGLIAIVALASISNIGSSTVQLFGTVGDSLNDVNEAGASAPAPAPEAASPTPTPDFALLADPDGDTTNEWPSATGAVATGGSPAGTYSNGGQHNDTTPFWVSEPLTGEFTLSFDASPYTATPGGNVGVVLMDASTGIPYWGPVDFGYGRIIERASYGQWIGGGPFIRRNLPGYSYGGGIGNIDTRFVVTRNASNQIVADVQNTSGTSLFTSGAHTTADAVRVGIFYSAWGTWTPAEMTISNFSLTSP